MRNIKFLIVGALVASFVGAMATSAVANPPDQQRFAAAVKGKQGTSKKAKAVQLTLNPYHDVSNLNAVLESPPFATVFAHTYYPSAVSIDTSKVPGCAEVTILDNPDACPKGSEVSVPGAGVAAGYARPVNAGVGVGAKVDLVNRVFVIAGVKNTLAVRVKTPLTTAIMRSVYRKATSAEKKLGFGSASDYTIPIGLIQPAPGLMSQLTNFKGVIAAKTYGGKPLVGLKKCPSNKKLLMGYMGEYNINLSTGDKGMGVTSPANGGFSVNAKSPIIKVSVPCGK